MDELFNAVLGPRRGSGRPGAGQGIASRALNRVIGMAWGDTCYLCEVGSQRVVKQASKRSIRADGVGTCVECSVHACPQHGDRYEQEFRCADCLGRMGAADIAGDDPSAGGESNEAASQSPDSNAAAYGTRRLLTANGAAITVREAEILRRALARPRTPLGALEDTVYRVDPEVLWQALGLRLPDLPAEDREGLLFDPRDVRGLVLVRLASMDAAASDTAGRLAEQRDAIDWSELTLYVALPIASRGSALGDPLLQIAGGLTLPPIIAVLAQAHADAARLD